MLDPISITLLLASSYNTLQAMVGADTKLGSMVSLTIPKGGKSVNITYSSCQMFLRNVFLPNLTKNFVISNKNISYRHLQKTNFFRCSMHKRLVNSVIFIIKLKKQHGIFKKNVVYVFLSMEWISLILLYDLKIFIRMPLIGAQRLLKERLSAQEYSIKLYNK